MKIVVNFRSEQHRQDYNRYVESFNKMTEETLSLEFIKQRKIGVVGVNQQGIYLMAMDHEFVRRYGKSPILTEDGIVGFKNE